MSEITHKTGKLDRIKPPKIEVTPGLRPFIEQLRHSKEPRDQVLAQLAESSDMNRQETQWQTPLLIETHYQTHRTNGRVTRIEFLIMMGKIVIPTILVTLAVLGIFDPKVIGNLLKLLISIGS